jgi:hypothetical protein
MESDTAKITSSNSTSRATIKDPISLEIERLCAHTRELIVLAMEINHLYEEVRELMALALQFSLRAVEMKRNSRRIKGQHSRSVN